MCQHGWIYLQTLVGFTSMLGKMLVNTFLLFIFFLIFVSNSSFDGTNVIAVASSGYIYYSHTSGGSWYQTTNSFTTESIYCLSHSSSLIAMAGGASGYVAKTNDGGESWTKMTVFSSSSVSVQLHSISLLSNTDAYVAGDDGSVYMTVNFGSSWSRIASTGAILYSLSVYDSLTAIAGSAAGSGVYVMVPGIIS